MCVIPHGSVAIVQLIDVIIVVSVVLVPHGILVHGSVGLRGGVEGRRDAVAGLTAVVAVPVVHSAVWVVVCSHKDSGRLDKMKGRDKNDAQNCATHYI